MKGTKRQCLFLDLTKSCIKGSASPMAMQQWVSYLEKSYKSLSLLQLSNAQRETACTAYPCHRRVHEGMWCSIAFWLPAPKMYIVHRSVHTSEGRRGVCLVTSFLVLTGNIISSLKCTRVSWPWISFEKRRAFNLQKGGLTGKQVWFAFFWEKNWHPYYVPGQH